MLKNLKGFSLVASLLVLGGCSSIEEVQVPAESAPPTPLKATKSDGPPHEDIDVTHIPNAVPKVEPLSRYGNPPVYEVFGKRYKVMDKSKRHEYSAKGIASWYGQKFHGLRTSSGETYDMFAMTAAHRSLPIPTYAKVKNLNNGKEVIVKVNDRGPFVGDRLIDLSYAAAKKLGFHQEGVAKVHITAIDPVAWNKENEGKTLLADTDKKLYLQLGAFNKKLSAEELANQATILTQAHNHIDVHVLPEKESKHSLYKVRVGPVKNKEEAHELQKQFLSLNGTAKATLVYE